MNTEIGIIAAHLVSMAREMTMLSNVSGINRWMKVGKAQRLRQSR